MRIIIFLCLMIAVICGGCRSGMDCKVTVPDRFLALKSLPDRTFCVAVFTGKMSPVKKKFKLTPLLSTQLTGLLIDGSTMPVLRSQINARALLKNNVLQLSSFAETCRFIGCERGMLCTFSEFRGSGDSRSVKVTLAWVDAADSKIIALAVCRTNLTKGSDLDDFKSYCGKAEQSGDFLDFAALRTINGMFKNIKKLK